jgi:hypothetical protein
MISSKCLEELRSYLQGNTQHLSYIRQLVNVIKCRCLHCKQNEPHKYNLLSSQNADLLNVAADGTQSIQCAAKR